MSFDKFLWAVESHDLSQADNCKGQIFCTEIKILNSESHDLGLLSLYLTKLLTKYIVGEGFRPQPHAHRTHIPHRNICEFVKSETI